MTAKEHHTSTANKKDKHKKTNDDKIKKRKYDKTSPNNNNNNNDTPANKKRALKKQRQSSRRHHTDVERAKEIWNKLRIKANTTNDNDDNEDQKQQQQKQRHQLMSELMTLLKDKMHAVALQHDASRVVQAAIQFGSTEQRRVILEELCSSSGSSDGNGGGGGLAELAKFQYAHFVVLKLIKYCGREERDRRLIVKALRGNFSKLATHAVAARVVELLLATFPPSSTQSLRLEFYGPQAKLLLSLPNNPTTNLVLTTILSSSSSSSSSSDDDAPLIITQQQKTSLLNHVIDLLTKMSQKQLHSFAYYHNLLHDYLTASATSSSPPTPISTLSHQLSLFDHTLSLLTTRSGTLALCHIVTELSAKDRRKFLKACKGYTKSLLCHDDAYLFVLRLCDVVDDTVTVHRCLLNELLVGSGGRYGSVGQGDDDGNKEKETKEEDESDAITPMLELAMSDTGHKLFLLLLHPEKPSWCFHPFERNDVLSSSSSSESKNASKKDAMTRRNELLSYVKMALINVCVTNTEQLMRSRVGCKVLRGVLNVWGERAAAADGEVSTTTTTMTTGDGEEITAGVVEEAIIKACLESVASSSDDDNDDDNKNQNDNDNDNNKTTPPLSSSSLFDDAVGHLFLKQQLRPPQTTTTTDSSSSSIHTISTTASSSSLAKRFHEAFKGRLLDHVATSNRGAFVVAALAESSEEMTMEVKKELLNELKATKKKKREGKGFEVLMNVLDGK